MGSDPLEYTWHLFFFSHLSFSSHFLSHFLLSSLFLPSLHKSPPSHLSSFFSPPLLCALPHLNRSEPLLPFLITSFLSKAAMTIVSLSIIFSLPYPQPTTVVITTVLPYLFFPLPLVLHCLHLSSPSSLLSLDINQSN